MTKINKIEMNSIDEQKITAKQYKNSVPNSISDLQIHKALRPIEEVAKTIVKRLYKKSEVALEILGNI